MQVWTSSSGSVAACAHTLGFWACSDLGATGGAPLRAVLPGLPGSRSLTNGGKGRATRQPLEEPAWAGAGGKGWGSVSPVGLGGVGGGVPASSLVEWGLVLPCLCRLGEVSVGAPCPVRESPLFHFGTGCSHVMSHYVFPSSGHWYAGGLGPWCVGTCEDICAHAGLGCAERRAGGQA